MLYSQAIKALKEQTPVYCIGRKYRIKENKVKSRYHVFVIEPIGPRANQYETLKVGADSLELMED
ncbi:hypothetical protein [Lactobacillus taiwanensis]|uniref:hypothetical protein n=1 Tax=Lactobacillus taiwanensis TaxID=508451 RepID=UPI0026214DFE|nr:hypothetical protein [Lactobacillus taiwanensis]